MKNERRCILLVVDALAEHIVRPAMEDGRLPHMAELARGGQALACTSMFPSITPAATCTIATGLYPAGHGIEGAFWYDRDQQELAYYGDDLQLILHQGMHRYLIDFGDRLNNERLQAPTIFERLADAGISSGCVNYMWFRGRTAHRRTTPLLLRAVAGKLPDEVMGPEMLRLGDFVSTWPAGMEHPPSLPGGMFRRYGFDDATTAACMLAMAQADQLPRFTLAYFPKNDDDSHDKGPKRAVATALEAFDDFLGQLVEALGGWERFREQYAVLIVGDHAASEVADDDQWQCISLTDILGSLSLADPAHGWQPDDRLFVCPNMRAAAIYQRTPDDELRQEVCRRLLNEPRVDQVIWSAPSGDTPERFFVATSDRGELQFQRAGSADDPAAARDALGNAWQLTGSAGALDLRVVDGQIQEGVYPNPLERIEGSFVRGSDPIWVTAREGCELTVSEVRAHRAGSHGSLLAHDSQSILLTSGLPEPLSPPQRTVDIMRLCLQAVQAPLPEVAKRA